MKKHIVCLGDSNTHGYCADPMDCAGHGIRYDENERWTQLLQAELGETCLVAEEGLSGRTTCFTDPLHEGMSALDYITPCLKSHEFVDLLIIMLGTNDSKDRFGVTAAEIGIAMGRLVRKALATDCWGGRAPNILVVAPPPIGEGILRTEYVDTMGVHCPRVSAGIAQCYREQCALLGVHFLDAGELGCEFNRIDYMHLTRKGHATLAHALAAKVPQLLSGASSGI